MHWNFDHVKKSPIFSAFVLLHNIWCVHVKRVQVQDDFCCGWSFRTLLLFLLSTWHEARPTRCSKEMSFRSIERREQTLRRHIFNMIFMLAMQWSNFGPFFLFWLTQLDFFFGFDFYPLINVILVRTTHNIAFDSLTKQSIATTN